MTAAGEFTDFIHKGAVDLHYDTIDHQGISNSFQVVDYLIICLYDERQYVRISYLDTVKDCN